MPLQLHLEGLRKTKVGEHAVRFFFGGAVSVVTGIVALEWGPRIGGLFLAFPAILPASLTLVKKHDGRDAAIDDARGSRIGALGLVGFAGVVWALADRCSPVFALAAALVAWVAIASVAWVIVYGRRDSK